MVFFVVFLSQAGDVQYLQLTLHYIQSTVVKFVHHSGLISSYNSFFTNKYIVAPPPLLKGGGRWGGGGRTFKNWVTWGVPKILLERGITLKRIGGWCRNGGGLPLFYYFNVQLHFLGVVGKSKVSFITFWFFSLWS